MTEATGASETTSTSETTGGQEGEIVVENGSNPGTARRWAHETGTLAAFTAVFFIYSMAR